MSDARRPLAEAAHDERLERLADLEDVADEVVVDDPHARALIGVGDDEALALQPPERLAHRIGADPVARREILGLQPGARLEHAGDDVAAQVVGDAMREAGFLGHLPRLDLRRA